MLYLDELKFIFSDQKTWDFLMLWERVNLGEI